jgi:hypothetical protein
MKLTKNTKVNAVIFHKNGTDLVIGSMDLNMTFNEYDKLAKGMTQSMLNLDYKLKSTLEDEGYIFNHYIHESDKYHAQFIELLYK